MGWRDIISSPDPSRALYEALRRNPTASRIADTFQGGFEGAMEGMGQLAHGATVPARAIAGAAYNAAGTGRPVDVSDYALYGRDLETGLQAVQYGDLLAGTMEDAGELKPGGLASKLVRLAGNVITDPGAAPGLLTGAEALGALAGPRALPPSGPLTMSNPRPFRPPPGRPTQMPPGPVPLTRAPAPGPGQPGGLALRPPPEPVGGFAQPGPLGKGHTPLQKAR